MDETEARCRPSDCTGRGRVGEMCKRHGDYHDFGFFRHCDANGNLVHLNVSMCVQLKTIADTLEYYRIRMTYVKANVVPQKSTSCNSTGTMS